MQVEERWKSVWLSRTQSDDLGPLAASGALQVLRAGALLDWERARELARVIFSFLFTLLAAGAGIQVLPEGTARYLAGLFAAAMLVEGITALIYRLRRERLRPEMPVREFVARAHRRAEEMRRLEAVSQLAVLVLSALALIVVLYGPTPAGERAMALDKVASMGILTALLLVAWLRARSFARSWQISRDLESCLQQLGE